MRQALCLHELIRFSQESLAAILTHFEDEETDAQRAHPACPSHAARLGLLGFKAGPSIWEEMPVSFCMGWGAGTGALGFLSL